MEQETKKINRTIKLFPILNSFTGDMIFFVPIDTLFLTLTKGLTASQITAMTMVSLIVCILLQKFILKISKKIGNCNSVKLGILLLLISSIILTFGKSFILILLHRSIFEIAFMFLNMDRIILKNDLNAINKDDEYYTIRNKAKIMYALITMFAAMVSGYLFNYNNYLPMYLSIIIYIIMFILSFLYYENVGEFSNTNKRNSSKMKMNSIIFLVIISNALFYSIVKMGQNNSKLFMQYDFQKYLSIEAVTYYITTIVLISRVVRLIGNAIFGKIYLKIKDKMSIVLSVALSMAFFLLIVGHFVNIQFIYKVIIMASGFFLILGTRDSFQVYIEDIALQISNKEEQQKVMIDIEIYRKIGTLILSAIFTLLLMKYEMIVIEVILFTLAVIEILINKKLCNRLQKINEIKTNR